VDVRIRSLVLAFLTLVSVAACSSSKKSPTGNTTTPGGNTSTTATSPANNGGGTFSTETCAQLAQAGAAFAQHYSELTDPSKRDSAITALQAGLTAFKNAAPSGTPSDVLQALDKLIQALGDYKDAISGSGTPDPAKLQQLGQVFETEGTKISAYVSSKCPTSS
jgi:hypothetical protein